MNEKEELGEIRICEKCGKEYEVNGFNYFAPFSMCDACYDDYLIENFNENEHDFN
ncbi:hypothetical protein [Bacteroides caccae]|uniref:hypothetical protein n=1 Tax=Bacteroides caccae TaxID=47678 RepID=UPI0022AB456C|nr:hypothetical protein [Bacteroides caccae]MCZ2726245.1 hypothetical protein [Bacteroides caccae]